MTLHISGLDNDLHYGRIYLKYHRKYIEKSCFYKLLDMILKQRIEIDKAEGYTEKFADTQYGFEKYLGIEP